MDDGYGSTHVIGEGYFDETLINDIEKAEDNSEIYEELMDIVPDTDIDLYEIGNPSGYGNIVDEFRIYVDGVLFKTI